MVCILLNSTIIYPFSSNQFSARFDPCLALLFLDFTSVHYFYPHDKNPYQPLLIIFFDSQTMAVTPTVDSVSTGAYNEWPNDAGVSLTNLGTVQYDHQAYS
jgi:hypothetical protein